MKTEDLTRASILLKTWKTLERLPGGKRLFSQLIGRVVPYSGTIGARFLELAPGMARVRFEDRRGVRNHLNSIHAMALANLAELASGMAMAVGMPDEARGILTGFRIEYDRKARGPLEATCEFDPPRTSEEKEYDVEVSVRDQEGQVVAKAVARWLIGARG